MQAIKSPLPYPEVNITTPNLKYAKILSTAFGGPESEFTAIAQYTFEHIMTADYPEISDTLAAIAMTEMHHLELLGEMMYALGMPPTFATDYRGHLRYWNGRDVNYTTDIKQILADSIAGEKAAVEDYTRMMRMIDDMSVNDVLERIIADEKMHVATLTNLYKKYIR